MIQIQILTFMLIESAQSVGQYIWQVKPFYVNTHTYIYIYIFFVL